MVLEQLWREIPSLETVIRQQTLVSDREQAWLFLRQLMMAHAPTTGAGLPGGIIDQVSDIAAVFGLADRLVPDMAGPGCPGLWVGVARDSVDLLIVTPLDRLTFRPARLVDDATAVLSKICSDGEIHDIAQTPAKALRFDGDRGRLTVAAQGQVASFGGELRFRAEHGVVTWADAITFDLMPRRQNDWVRGGGLDNAAGVLCALATAAVLRQIEESLLEQNRRCVFVFPDRRDIDVSNLTRGGAERVQPGLGTVWIEGQPIASETGPQYEAGAVYSFANEKRCGLHVPLNYQQLMFDLDSSFLNLFTAMAQFVPVVASGCGEGERNYCQRTLGVMGPPLSRPHAGQEMVHLQDLASSTWWIATYVSLVLNLVPSVTARYALGR